MAGAGGRRTTLACGWALLMLLLASGPAARGAGLADIWRGVRWGEPAAALAAGLGLHASVLPRPIDFGDSYAAIARRDVALGGVPLVAFYQMDKRTGGLKRIQLERQRHGVTAAAFRAVLGALEAEFGGADLLCGIPPEPAAGYQAAAERVWRRGGVVIRAIFRDTTIEAFEGCLGGDPSVFGPCGLTGQLLVRISPPQTDGAGCPAPPRRR